MPRTVNSSFQPGRVVSFHNNLSIFPGIDEAGLDGRVSINIARERQISEHDKVTVYLCALT